MTGDELIGDVVEVFADDLRLRPDAEHVVAGAPDQRRLPSRRDRAERVPGVAGNQAELRGLHPKLFLDVGISLPGRLVMLDAVSAEPPLKQVGDTAMFKLARLNLKQIIGEREQPKARIAQSCAKPPGLPDTAASSKIYP